MMKPNEQDIKLYEHVATRIRRACIGIPLVQYESTLTHQCLLARKEGLICDYSITIATGNLTIGKDKVLGRFSIRLRDDVEHKSYLVHARVE